MECLLSNTFDRMVAYPEHSEVPLRGQSETLIGVWRQMEAVRRAFKAPQGRPNHLKLFQFTHYLREKNLRRGWDKIGKESGWRT
jgi:hypothetical protein